MILRQDWKNGGRLRLWGWYCSQVAWASRSRGSFTCDGESRHGVRGKMDPIPLQFGEHENEWSLLPHGSGEQHPSPWEDQVWFYLQATLLSLSMATVWLSSRVDGLQEKPTSILSTLAAISGGNQPTLHSTNGLCQLREQNFSSPRVWSWWERDILQVKALPSLETNMERVLADDGHYISLQSLPQPRE